MLRRFAISFTVALLCWSLTTPAEAAITQVAKRLNVLEFTLGYAYPIGSYDGIDIIDFIDSQGRLVDLDADKVYDPGFYLGLSYGQLRNDHILFNIGFRWTHINTEDMYQVDPVVTYYFAPETPTFNQYDLDFNLNYYFLNPSQVTLAPYLGAGLHAGFTSATSDLYESEHDLNLAFGLNFGADFTVWEAVDGRSFMTLSSVNEWVLAASDGRPKYLNLGAAFKYYFRP